MPPLDTDPIPKETSSDTPSSRARREHQGQDPRRMSSDLGYFIFAKQSVKQPSENRERKDTALL